MRAPVCQLLYCATVLFRVLYCRIRNVLFILYVCLLCTFYVKSMINLWQNSAAAAAKSLQSCPTLWDPIDSSPPGSTIPRIRFSRQEHWSGLPFPSPMQESEKWKGSLLVVSDSSRPHPMDCSPPGSSVHGIFQARVLEWGAIAFSDDRTVIYSQLC